jgi:Family of unknown function (DUF6081)
VRWKRIADDAHAALRGLVDGSGRGVALAASPAVAKRTVVRYDDFSGGAASYARKWALLFSLEQQFGATNLPAFAHGALRLAAVPFRGWMDTGCAPLFQVCVNADHVKYDAFSTRAFAMPKRGSMTVSADIEALTSGTRPGYVVRATGRRIPEDQQAAAVLQVTDEAVGQTFDWFVSRHEASPKIERTLAPVGTVGLDRAYTQFLPSVRIRPNRSHRFAIRYRRGLSRRDDADWLIDGRRVATVHDVGIPLDVQNPARWGHITFRSLGPGERVASKMDVFILGHGLYSFVDSFPFFPAYELFPAYPQYFVSIPKEQRIFGQGVDATFDNFRVETVTGR